MIRLDAIRSVEARPKRFGPFTSAISAAALLGLYIGLMSDFLHLMN